MIALLLLSGKFVKLFREYTGKGRLPDRAETAEK